MNGIMFSLLSALLGFVFVCVAIPPLIRVVRAKNLFETHEERKVHTETTPTIGGVSIFIGFMLASTLASDGYSLHGIKYLYPALVIMFFIGLKDDLLILPAKKKFGVQIVTAAMLVTIGGLRLQSFYGVLGVWQVSWWLGAPVAAVLILAFINAYNFIDGIDGLASGIAVLTSGVFGVCFILMEQYGLAIVSFALTGSAACFFRFNVFSKKYKLFMGDTGSLIIGTILAVLALKYINLAPVSPVGFLSHASPAFAVGLLILPIIDLLRIFFIRLWQGKSPFTPDGNHIHHKILKQLPSHIGVTLILLTSNILFMAYTLFLISTGLNINFIISIQLLTGFLMTGIPNLFRKGALFGKLAGTYRSYPD